MMMSDKVNDTHFKTNRLKYRRLSGGLAAAVLLALFLASLFGASFYRAHSKLNDLSVLNLLLLLCVSLFAVPAFISLVILLLKIFLYERELKITIEQNEFTITSRAPFFSRTLRFRYEEIRLLTASAECFVIRFKNRKTIWIRCLDDNVKCFRSIIRTGLPDFIVDQDSKTKAFDAAESKEAILKRRSFR